MLYQKSPTDETTRMQNSVFHTHLAAEIIVGHIQSKKGLQACRFGVAVL